MPATKIVVNIPGETPYDVRIGAGVLGGLGAHVAALPALASARRALVVTDGNVAPLYAARTKESLAQAGFRVSDIVVPAGEESKSLEVAGEVWEAMAALALGRDSVVVALGGGVVGDLAGFVASTYMRGVPVVQVPTTLLAMVDSSVGGKTAVNLSAGKNLAGAFWQPSLVLCDCDVFQTLPAPVFADGMAEAVKAGMIADAQLLDMLEDGAQPLPALVSRCVQIKRGLVAADERDVGDRQLLNFGHTAAHAIERATDFQVSHGSAVAIGMVMMARAAWRLGVSEEDCAPRLAALLQKLGLPTRTDLPASVLAEAALRDKKRSGAEITLVLPIRRGRCILHRARVEELMHIFELGRDA